jgi:hypothetical protein
MIEPGTKWTFPSSIYWDEAVGELTEDEDRALDEALAAAEGNLYAGESEIVDRVFTRAWELQSGQE